VLELNENEDVVERRGVELIKHKGKIVPNKKERLFLESISTPLQKRDCPYCGHEWFPVRLSSTHCSKCRKEIGLSPQGVQYLEAFKESGGKMDLPILDETTRNGLIEEATKGISDLVGKKVDERLGSALGNLAGIFLRKFAPFIEEKLGDVNLENFRMPNLDTPQGVKRVRISNVSPEMEDRLIAAIMGKVQFQVEEYQLIKG
jgi:uncharacterized Zn-finger protein